MPEDPEETSQLLPWAKAIAETEELARAAEEFERAKEFRIPRKKKFLLRAHNTIRWGALLFISIFLTIKVILAGYPVSWTGFGNYTLPNGDFMSEKNCGTGCNY